MENNQNMEQPLEIGVQVEVNELIEENKDTITADNNSSNFGKFKDATSLLQAYESLEKEFTRKSQKLSSLLKEQTSQENNDNTITSPEFYKQKNWQTNVSNFLNENPDAKNYTKEIANILINDKELSKSKDCLKYAYYKVINGLNIVNPATALNNQNFFDEIVKNKKVKDKIINDYLLNIQSNKKNLHIISGEPNFISPTRKPDKPTTLKEASQILKKLLPS